MVKYPDTVSLFVGFVISTSPNGIWNLIVLFTFSRKIMAKKKIQMAGGVKQGEANPTWLKQKGDVPVVAFGAALVGFGLIQLGMGMYKLAYNKGKKD
jgi:hypothetical protein